MNGDNISTIQGYDEDRYDLLHTEKKEKIRHIILKCLFWIISVPLVIMAAFFLCNKMIKKTVMTGSSMAPTLADGDKIIINTLSYRLSSPKRFDVIVIKREDGEHSQVDVKRIYGLPGEEIQIISGEIYINGKVLQEEIAVEPMMLAGIAADPVKLSEGQYFVLADDRNHSEDSRYSGYGLVKKKDIIGKAWIRTNEFGFINKLNRAENKKEEK